MQESRAPRRPNSFHVERDDAWGVLGELGHGRSSSMHAGDLLGGSAGGGWAAAPRESIEEAVETRDSDDAREEG